MPLKNQRTSWLWQIPREQLIEAIKVAKDATEFAVTVGGTKGAYKTLRARLETEKINWDRIKPKYRIPRNWKTLPKPASRPCSKCNKALPFTEEFFAVHRRQPWGLQAFCKRRYNATSLPKNLESARKIRLKVLSHYGRDGKLGCQCCGEARIEFLSLDHIEGNGRTDRLKHGSNQQVFRHLVRDGFPPGYRTLCHNCNMSLGLYGYCPHSKEMAANA
jgi:hypothetical protein